MAKLLLAKPLIEENVAKLTKQCKELAEQGLTPKMKVILVGNNSASQVYVKHKSKMCDRIGADFELLELPENISKEDFLKHIDDMNNDPKVTGCFVQLPIPKHLSDLDVTALINPKKDVDGFHSDSFTSIYKNSDVTFFPCTPKGIITLLKHYDVEIEGKDVVVLGRSLIVGKPISLMFNNLNATVTMCHSRTKNLEEHTKRADIVVAAIGRAKFLTDKHFNDSKKQIVIDVGMNRDEDGKLCGDVDFAAVENKVGAITPVPGGVGPLTVYSLIENLIVATNKILNDRK